MYLEDPAKIPSNKRYVTTVTDTVTTKSVTLAVDQAALAPNSRVLIVCDLVAVRR